MEWKKIIFAFKLGISNVLLFVDRKNCEGLSSEKPFDLAYNAASFLWNPEKGAKVHTTGWL